MIHNLNPYYQISFLTILLFQRLFYQLDHRVINIILLSYLKFMKFIAKGTLIGLRPIFTFATLNREGFIYRNEMQSKASFPNRFQQCLTYAPRFGFSDEGNKGNKLSRQQKFKLKTQEMMKEVPENEQDQTSYTKSDNKLAKYLMGISVIALLMAYGMMEIQGIRAQKKIDHSITGVAKVTSVGKVQIGGDWTLTDTKGRRFGSKDLEGSYYLIYFGFTNCPDICPNSLLKLSKALQKIRKMPEYQYMDLKTIFVSVDPDRDTPEKIQKFLSYFDKSIIGVTAKSNNDQQLKECMKSFKIYASKIEFEDEDTVKKGRKSYTIDHTILTYLMSDSNEYLAHLGANLGEHELAKIIIEKFIDNEHNKMKLLKAA